MNKIKIFISWLNLPRLFLHLFLYLAKSKYCKDDVERTLKNIAPIGHVQGFMYLMVFDKYYRNLFYYRIGKWKYLISFFAPPHPCLTVGTYTRIGKGCHFEHPFSTIINAESIGENFEIRNTVTIGEKDGKKPVIKDNVVINANSVVIGNIVVGNNVVIGAGTVLTKSVPDNCIVIGNPAYILKKDGERVNMAL